MSDKTSTHLSDILEQYNKVYKKHNLKADQLVKKWLKNYCVDNNLSSNDLLKIADYIKIHLKETSLHILSAQDFLVWVMVVCLVNTALKNLVSPELHEWIAFLSLAILTLWSIIRVVINIKLKQYIRKHENLRIVVQTLSGEKELA